MASCAMAACGWSVASRGTCAAGRSGCRVADHEAGPSAPAARDLECVCVRFNGQDHPFSASIPLRLRASHAGRFGVGRLRSALPSLCASENPWWRRCIPEICRGNAYRGRGFPA